jgi:hypothetical protein
MRLKNAHLAIISEEKLTGYVLSTTHRDGRHKARVFLSALGLTAEDADVLCKALADAVRHEEATETGKNVIGTLYPIDFPMATASGSARVMSGWIIRHGEDFPRLTTCHVIN